MLGDIETQELTQRGILAGATCFFHNMAEPDLSVAEWVEAYEKGVMLNEHMHAKIASIMNAYESGRHLIIVERIEHGDALAKAIPGALWVHGQDSDAARESVIAQLQRSKPGEKVVAIASRILQTGVDLFLHSLTNAAGYQSDIATIQRFGRGLRVAPDKERLDYHDFMFTNNMYLEKHSNARKKWLR